MSEKRLFEKNTEYRERINNALKGLENLEKLDKGDEKAEKQIDDVKSVLVDLFNDLESFDEEYK